MIDERNDQLAFLIVKADAKISQLEEKILQFSKLRETELVPPTVQEEMLLPTIESTESDESVKIFIGQRTKRASFVIAVTR